MINADLSTMRARDNGYPYNKLCDQPCPWLLCAWLLSQLKTQLGWFQMSHAICLSRLVSYLCKKVLKFPLLAKLCYKIIILMIAWWFVIIWLAIDNFNYSNLDLNYCARGNVLSCLNYLILNICMLFAKFVYIVGRTEKVSRKSWWVGVWKVVQ